MTIHYINVGVALQRPPEVHEYRRYAIYGGTHADAELVACQMASCTSVMPVEVSRTEGPPADGWKTHLTREEQCARDCKKAEKEPHGAMGCRCWPGGGVDLFPGTQEEWLIDEHCPLHGSREMPPLATNLLDSGGKAQPAGACPCPCTACYEYCEVPAAPEAAASASEAPFAGSDEDTVPALLSPGRVECRWCPWYLEYTDEKTAYRQLVEHWSSGDCNSDDECDHGYCACGGAPAIQFNIKRSRVLTAIKRLWTWLWCNTSP